MFLDWDPEDRAKVMAYAMEQSARCNKCGTSSWEWDPERGGNVDAYEALPMKCPGCATLDIGREILGSDDKNPGVSIQLVPRATADRMIQTPRKRPRSKRERKDEDRR